MKSLVNIYRNQDYKKYLAKVEEDFRRFDRGFRTRLAEALGVQTAFISKVLNQDKAQFTLEQSLGIARFLELDADESAYLIWLVEVARAGTEELRAFFRLRITRAQETHLNLVNRVGQAATLSESDQNRFYSHWLFGATHVLTSIPRLRTLPALAQALRVDPATMHEVLVFLTQCGLVVVKGAQFHIGPTQLHLNKASPNIVKHHTNWRLKAIDDAADPRSAGVHYSTVSSLSLKDVERLRFELTEVIQRYVDVIRDSPEETACAFNLDFYALIKP